MSGRGPRRVWMAAVALGLSALSAYAQIAEPAELPPDDYAGQQYVDSKGCMFLRAGEPGRVIWIPRVTRQGVPLCGNPPSGQRVPVVEEGAPTTLPDPTAEPRPAAPAEPVPAQSAEGCYVAVGSFGVAANAERAAQQLTALNYPVAKGRLQGSSGSLVSVFAGPFASVEQAESARAELRNLGFPDAMVVGP